MDFDEIFGFSALGLRFPVSVAGFDGEDFRYSVYFDEDPEGKKDAVETAAAQFESECEARNMYPGWFGVSCQDGKVMIVHDLGNVDPEDIVPAIRGLLAAIDAVDGIREVVINEGVGFDLFDF